MRPVSLRLLDMKNHTIPLGFEGENEFTKVRIDCKTIFDQHPTAVPTLAVTDPAGNQYPAVIVRDGDIVEWTVTASDLTAKGDGEIQIIFTVDSDVIGKSDTAKTRVLRSITPSGEVPSGIENFIQQAGEILGEIENAIPAGGTEGQVMAKKSDADYDFEWVDQSGGGGGGGTSDYEDLSNKPSIAGVTLDGDISLSDIGAAASSDIPDVSGFYTKPQDGIPSTDLSSGVQTALNKADTAYQKPGSGIPASDLASGVIPDTSGFYTKPVSGIPASDIADGVIPDPTSIIDDTAGEGDTDKVLSADKVTEITTELTEAIIPKAETKTSNATDVDLDLTDENGNVLARFAGGHIETKNFNSRYPDNPFYGKKYAALGDSVTYGFIPRNYEGYPGQLDSFAKLTAEALGMTFSNHGISGSTLAYHADRSPMSRRYSDLPNDADLITVMGGTNDIRFGITLGQMSDRTDSTFYGALHVVLGGLYKKYCIDQGVTVGKTKKIIVCTPLKLLSASSQTQGGEGTLVDMSAWVEAIKEVAAYYAMPVMDFYNNSTIVPHICQTLQGTETGYTGYYNPYITDGTHPTQEAAEIMADEFIGFLKTLK